jgi:hypothetical protein
MSGINELVWRQAWMASNPNNYIPYDLSEVAEILIDRTTPETLLEDKERQQAISSFYQDMSDEAKQIIGIILNSPQEMASIFFTPSGQWAKGKTVKNKLVVMMTRQWKDRRYAKKVVREIEDFVKVF